MKNFMRIDAKKRQIIMDKTFYNRSLYFGTEEYNLLQMARKDYPGFTPVRREIRKPDHPIDRHKGLTYVYSPSSWKRGIVLTRPCAEVAFVPRRGFTILRTFLDFLMRKMKSKEKCIFPEKAVDDIEKGRVVRPFFCLMGWYQLSNWFYANANIILQSCRRI